MIACIGLKDLVIVDSGDAVLVCHQDRVGDIKKLLSKLKEEGRGAPGQHIPLLCLLF